MICCNGSGSSESLCCRERKWSMSRYWNDIPEYTQPDAGTLKRKAKESAKREASKGKRIEPVTVTGRTLVKSW